MIEMHFLTKKTVFSVSPATTEETCICVYMDGICVCINWSCVLEYEWRGHECKGKETCICVYMDGVCVYMNRSCAWV